MLSSSGKLVLTLTGSNGKKTQIEPPYIQLASAAKSMWVQVNAWAVFTKLVSLPNKHQRFYTASMLQLQM